MQRALLLKCIYLTYWSANIVKGQIEGQNNRHKFEFEKQIHRDMGPLGLLLCVIMQHELADGLQIELTTASTTIGDLTEYANI